MEVSEDAKTQPIQQGYTSLSHARKAHCDRGPYHDTALPPFLLTPSARPRLVQERRPPRAERKLSSCSSQPVSQLRSALHPSAQLIEKSLSHSLHYSQECGRQDSVQSRSAAPPPALQLPAPSPPTSSPQPERAAPASKEPFSSTLCRPIPPATPLPAPPPPGPEEPALTAKSATRAFLCLFDLGILAIG